MAGLIGLVAVGQADADADADADGKMVSGVVRRAIERGLSVPGARLDGAFEDRGLGRALDCRATSAELLRPIDGSGRVAVKVAGRSAHGQSCEAWTWVRVRVVAPVAVATRALTTGDRLDGATIIEERELRAGHAPAYIGPASVAARAVSAGQLIEAAQVSEPMLRLGQTVNVVIVSGSLVIEQAGRGAPCARGRSCATLASGKLVEGELREGKLMVQAP
ncbi:MAG TPA: hypothetical protein VFH68_23450 [Polyangia bacterium]|nr:hypothetical protein [Polyangia bacterium]